jgi:DNA-binding transcriptional ArsR family regulator
MSEVKEFSTEEINAVAALSRAVDNDYRRVIMQLIKEHKTLSVDAITEMVSQIYDTRIEHCVISTHLQILSGAKILKTNKERTSVFYTFSDEYPKILEILGNVTRLGIEKKYYKNQKTRVKRYVSATQ